MTVRIRAIAAQLGSRSLSNDFVRRKNASEAARAVKTDVQFSRIGALAGARFTPPFPDKSMVSNSSP